MLFVKRTKFYRNEQVLRKQISFIKVNKFYKTNKYKTGVFLCISQEGIFINTNNFYIIRWHLYIIKRGCIYEMEFKVFDENNVP